MNPYKLYFEFVLGLLGTGYFIAGKKRSDSRLLGCGLALGLMPYFVDNIYLIVGIAVGLLVLPFVFKSD